MMKLHELERPIAYLDKRETEKLELKEEKVRQLLLQDGLSKKEVSRRTHNNMRDVVERKSGLSPYEALRARHVLDDAIGSAGLDEEGGVAFTVSILQHRTACGELLEYEAHKAFRKWREAIRNLKKMGLNVVGVCVLEINLCRPLDAAAFWEPHLHGIIWGASAKQIKRAFVIRKLAKFAVRKRATKFVPLKDLDGYVRYMTKVRSRLHSSATDPSGDSGIGRTFPNPMLSNGVASFPLTGSLS